MNYTITKKTKILGKGNFGSVYKSHSKHNKEHEVAIKVLDKSKLGSNLRSILNEITILHALDHPNICKYVETYDDPKFLYLVMEYIDGEHLFSKLTSTDH
jgi:serine/threonine protein kinase